MVSPALVVLWAFGSLAGGTGAESRPVAAEGRPELVKRQPAPDGRCYTNTTVWQVPYRLENPPPATSLLKPALYYSTDGGANWRLGAIDADGVPPVAFEAPGDGEYVLRMGLRRLGETTVPSAGRDPEGAGDHEPPKGVLAVVVDTRPPRVRLVPRLVQRAGQGPALALKVAIEDEPLEPPDVALEVEFPATETAPASRHLWVPHAAVGTEHLWPLNPREGTPAAFLVTAVDAAGNVGRDALQMSLLVRQAAFRDLAQPEIVRPVMVGPPPPGVIPQPGVGEPDAGGALMAVVEYTVDGPALGPEESVELWCTEDDGHSWRSCARHDGPTRPLLFAAPRPGLYGLRLVLRRGDAILGEPPTAGTKPQTYVVMERAAEDARIVRVAAAGETRLGPAAAANTPADLKNGHRPSGAGPQADESPTPDRSAADARGPVARPPWGVATPSPHRGEGEGEGRGLIPSPSPLPGRERVSPARAPQARAAYDRANYLRLQGRWGEAGEAFAEALRHDPAYFEAQNDLAGCLYHRERFEEALAAYYRAVDLQPRHADARFSLARVLIRLGRPDEALAQLDEVVRLSPADGEAWLYRGELLFSRRGDLAGARASWQEALAHAPTPSAGPPEAGPRPQGILGAGISPTWLAVAQQRLKQHPAR